MLDSSQFSDKHWSVSAQHITYNIFLFPTPLLAGAVEYANCISVKGEDQWVSWIWN